MTPERWQQVEAILDAALELPATDRADLVRERCGEDAELRAEVERILAAGELPTPIPITPVSLAGSLLDGLIDAHVAEPVRERIGAYRVVRELGHGGMGTVYLAERDDDQYHKQVAIKLLRHGVGSGELALRFRHERQILARLEHPGIARLLDGGMLDGAPYIVMEYVDGLPLDRFCDAHALGLHERLQLFGEVCAAVQYAHQNLVVHRDLKPSNILVSATAGGAHVKLLDFGIAKLLDDAAVDAPLTRTGVQVMTPEYAAPEQVRAGAITTATDVYALGILLYQLLTGRRPYELAGRSLSEIERLICDTEPVRPSTAVKRAAADAPAHALLPRRLRGDLDTIVLKALQKDPERRYPSAAALLDDLRRFEHGHPVQARPDAPGYRARKFVQRHRVAVSVGVVLALAVQGFALRESQLRREAESAAARASAVRDFLAGVFQVSDPYGTSSERGEDVTARALLDRGAQRIDSALAGQPEARADLLGVLGEVYLNLGLLDRAQPLLQRSLGERRSLYGSTRAEVGEALDRLAQLAIQQGEYDRAEQLAGEALALRRRVHGTDHALTAQSLDRLATVYQERSEYDRAAPLFREALGIRERTLGPNDAKVAESANNLALLLWWLGDYEESEVLYRRAVAVNRAALGAEHPTTAMNLGNLAQLLHAKGEWEDAEGFFRESLATKRKAFGDVHPRVTVHLNNYAALLRDMGRLEPAERLAREALALDRQLFGEEHPYVAASRTRLAGIVMDLGRFAEADTLFRSALAMNRRLVGEEHVRVLQGLESLGMLRLRLGELEAAETSLRAARELAAKLFAADHLWVVTTAAGLAKVQQLRGEFTDAEPVLRALVQELPADERPKRNVLVNAHVALGELLAATNRSDEARPVLERALELAREFPGDSHWRTAEVRLALGTLHARAGRRADAEPLLRRALADLEASPARQPWLVERARAALGGSE